jgi:hypothetical protein
MQAIGFFIRSYLESYGINVEVYETKKGQNEPNSEDWRSNLSGSSEASMEGCKRPWYIGGKSR